MNTHGVLSTEFEGRPVQPLVVDARPVTHPFSPRPEPIVPADHVLDVLDPALLLRRRRECLRFAAAASAFGGLGLLTGSA